MEQVTLAWITVAGLALDFAGFMLLLREWWIAFLSEAAMMTHEEALERQRKFRAFTTTNAPENLRQHMTRAGEMQDDMAIRRARDSHRGARASRRRWFVASALLIFLGFVLQLVGALPHSVI